MGLATKTIKNSIYSFLGFIWPLILFFFSIPYFIHKLGMEGYGIWVLINSIIGTLGILNFGIGDALIKYVSEYHSKADTKTVNKVVGNSFLIYSFISAIILVVGMFGFQFFLSFFNIKENYKEVVGFVFRVSTLGFVINLFTYNALSILKGLQRYDISSKITIFSDTVKILGMVLMLYLGFGLKGMVIAYVAGTLFGFLLILFLLKKCLPEVQLKPFYEKATLKMIFSFSFYSFLSGISGIIRVNIGNILVGKFLGASFVPFFSIPLQVSTQILGAIGSLTNVMFPLFSSLKGSNEIDKIKKVFTDASKATAILGFGIGAFIFLFSHNILTMWLGPEFATIANIPFKIIIIGFIFALTAAVPYFFLMGYGCIKVITAAQNLTMLLILILGVPAVSIYGIVGMSIAYAIGTMSLAFYVYYASRILWLNRWPIQIVRVYLPATISLLVVILLFTFGLTVKAHTLAELLLYGVLCGTILLSINMLLDREFLVRFFRIVQKNKDFYYIKIS